MNPDLLVPLILLLHENIGENLTEWSYFSDHSKGEPERKAVLWVILV